MKKTKFYILFGIIGLILSTTVVQASGDIFTDVSDEESFDKCIKEEIACKLTDNISLTKEKSIDKNLILDLNGYAILGDNSLNLKSGLIVVNRGGNLTIDDSVGSGKISTGDSSNIWAAVQLIKGSTGNELAELTINGGIIEGYYYGITGNGNNHNTKVTINDGIIKGLNKEDSAGIYQPQMGEMIINGGTISGGTAIEIRSGDLTINKGNIEAVASDFIKVASKNGTTTNGVGVAVAQHTTKNPINVVIKDGNIKGQYAFYEWNPHKNSKSDLDKIKMHIYGGNFTGLATGVHAVYSEDFKNFISGGKFNTDVSEYLTDDAKLTFKTANSDVSMKEDKKNNNITIPIIITVIILGGIVVTVLICKKKKLPLF